MLRKLRILRLGLDHDAYEEFYEEYDSFDYDLEGFDVGHPSRSLYYAHKFRSYIRTEPTNSSGWWYFGCSPAESAAD